MMNNVLLWMILWLGQKLADAVADKVLEHVLSEENLARSRDILTLKIVALYLTALIATTPFPHDCKRK
ncbi:hypothetical protein [Lusitaniella coriacea]|uniref:hypothetical protein n=1 Tax=Lusitaniella coriacea TaxID=1983105 RepID=UPI003CEC70CF